MNISRQTFALVALVLLVGYAVMGLEQTANRETLPNKVTVTYWSGWTGDEAETQRKVIRDFNNSQDKIFVKFLSISGLRSKALLSINGGMPPDIFHTEETDIASFADANALEDLLPMATRDGIKRSDYIPIYWDLLSYDGKLCGMPMTPVSTAMHYNRKFLPPNVQNASQAPKTIEELDALVDKISKKRPDGSLELAGFLPGEPGWWKWAWGYFFGGKLYDEKTQKLTINSPENIRAFDWVGSYAKRFGVSQVQTFQSGFGNFASPQNAFMGNKVASVLQGVWMANFIHLFNPKMDWFAAPFPIPSNRPDLEGANVVGIDAILIPKGAKHVDAAWEFIRYQQTQKAMEKLCAGQSKHSPLAKVSEEFFQLHSNKEIRLFDRLARSKNPITAPKLGIWPQIADELSNALTEINLGKKPASQSLTEVQNRMQPMLDKYLIYVGKKKP
jgi:ABC-type glycerol-3-phosphate transport system substrate-binding protein